MKEEDAYRLHSPSGQAWRVSVVCIFYAKCTRKRDSPILFQVSRPREISLFRELRVLNLMRGEQQNFSARKEEKMQLGTDSSVPRLGAWNTHQLKRSSNVYQRCLLGPTSYPQRLRQRRIWRDCQNEMDRKEWDRKGHEMWEAFSSTIALRRLSFLFSFSLKGKQGDWKYHMTNLPDG